MVQETKSSRAWLLNFGNNLKAAIGHHEMWQVLISPQLFDIPCTPLYCNKVLVFQNHILPVCDIANFLNKSISTAKDNKNNKNNKNNRTVGIGIYQSTPTTPIHYAGIYLETMPQSIYVNDEQACDLPKEQADWGQLAISCFIQDEITIPIIDLAYLFSPELNNLRNRIN